MHFKTDKNLLQNKEGNTGKGCDEITLADSCYPLARFRRHNKLCLIWKS